MDRSQSFFRVPFPFANEDEHNDYGALGAGDPKAADNVSGLETQLVISIALGLFALLAFCALRTRWVVMFAPRTKLRRHTPPVLSSTFFGWIPQLLRIPEVELLECVGLDAVMLLRFYIMAAKLFCCCLIPGLLVIWPVNTYFSGGGNTPKDREPDDGDDYDFSALSPVSDTQGTSLLYLFTQFTFTWVFSLFTIYTIWQTYESFITLRRKYMLSRAKSNTNRTVMVTGLPGHLQNDRALATFYESLGAGQVESAHVCRHVRTLKRLIEQRAHALRDLEEIYASYYGNPVEDPSYDPEKIEAGNDRATSGDLERGTDEQTSLLRPNSKPRPTTRMGFLGLFGKKVDKIDQSREIFNTLDKAVQKMRMSRIFASSSVGFVTFEDMRAAQILGQTVNTQETLSCVTSLAPEPRDVFWDNLNLPPSELGVRSVVVNTIVFLLIFFWAGPIGLFSSFLNLKQLEKIFPGITVIAEIHPIIKSLIQGFLPTLGVTIFLAVVPKILEALCKSQGIQSHSAVARSLYNKYFTFILFNVVLVFTVVGTWAQAVTKVYHNLGELTLLLATSFPRVAPFFVNFLVLKGLGSFPLQLLQIGDVFEQTFRGFASKTPRDYAEVRAPPELRQGVVYANATLAFVIVLIYSCIKPIILIFGAIYFAVGYVVYKYQLLYVFFHPYESNGKSWPMVYNRLTIGLIIFQLTMLGLFMLKQSYLLGSLLVPLPIGTVWFWLWTTKAYKLTAEFIPLELIRPEEMQAYQDESNPASPALLATAVGPANQVPGHVLIDVDQNGGAPSAQVNGTGKGIAVGTSTAMIIPRGTKRRFPKSAVDEDDYQAVPDRYTDYRQPPMTLYPGVLNSGMREYSHPAIGGPLPTLWLPLKKSDDKSDDKKPAQDDRTRIDDSDSDSDDEHHSHERIEAALARPPFMLPTQASDVPQSFDEGDNLVGGGQDEDLSKPSNSTEQENTATVATGAAAKGKEAKGKGVKGKEAAEEVSKDTTKGAAKGTAKGNVKDADLKATTAAAATTKTATTTTPATPIDAPSTQVRGPQAIVEAPQTQASAVGDASEQQNTPTKNAAPKNPAVEGVNDIYYHHPEKRGSEGSSTDDPPETRPVRTVQGQGSSAELLQGQANTAAASSTEDSSKSASTSKST
ncbi:hypothetical protein BGZ51_002631 [Haplosporangium sp. Z 767]|nr:hypothetical protein BGZ51_002631 [Haplosporangium sp. Z 767]KAF9197058.1 hypothetical protein BGZ50_000008 [Haplosporangium sp. Z 11]